VTHFHYIVAWARGCVERVIEKYNIIEKAQKNKSDRRTMGSGKSTPRRAANDDANRNSDNTNGDYFEEKKQRFDEEEGKKTTTAESKKGEKTAALSSKQNSSSSSNGGVSEEVKRARRASLAKVNARFGGKQKNRTLFAVDGTDPLLLKLEEQWSEVEFVLKMPLGSEDEVDAVGQSVDDGLWFLGEVARLSKESGHSRGAVSRMILPYHANTAVSTQRAEIVDADNSPLGEMVDRSVLAKLAEAANALRGLVRVKVADDADLDSAKRAVVLVEKFLANLRAFAVQMGKNRTECFQVIKQRAC